MFNIFDKVKLSSIRSPELDPSFVKRVIAEHSVEEWFWYAYADWKNRWHVWQAIYWIIRNIRKDARILETGCGCGWNLMWLAANGFTSLAGVDIDASAVAAGNCIARSASFPVDLGVDDAISPTSLDASAYDVIVALNWTYHVESFDLQQYLRSCSQRLSTGGFLVIDVVDSTYNYRENNEYLTSDWRKPKHLRRPSEYRKRYSRKEIEDVSTTGCKLVKQYARDSIIPKRICIFQKTTT